MTSYWTHPNSTPRAPRGVTTTAGATLYARKLPTWPVITAEIHRQVCETYNFLNNTPSLYMILTTQCPTPPHHICEVRPSCWRTFNTSVSLYYSTNSHVYCFCALPLWRERSIPFFCSTNVDPLTKLDIIAIVIPRFWEETAGSPESEAITAALFTSRFFEPQRHPADISASPQVSPASPMSRLKSESSVHFITPLCARRATALESVESTLPPLAQ